MLCAASRGQDAVLLDADTGAVIHVIKDCQPCGNGLCGAGQLLFSAETARSFIHIWSLQKEQPHYRCQAPERITCLGCTSDAVHCAGGGASGKVYLWQVATGKLLCNFDAHFKACAALTFAGDDGFILTAGEDAILLLWSLPQLLHAASSGGPIPPPVRTWTDHSLPVRSIAVAQCAGHDLVCSASTDHTIRVWRISEASRSHAMPIRFRGYLCAPPFLVRLPKAASTASLSQRPSASSRFTPHTPHSTRVPQMGASFPRRSHRPIPPARSRPIPTLSVSAMLL